MAKAVVHEGRPSDPSPQAVCEQLEKIVASPGFINAKRICDFLRFLVSQTLLGSPPKEHTVGVEVFSRNPSYDPRTDPVVRVEARRLRYKLKEYYDTDGKSDSVRLSLPKGGYAIVLEQGIPSEFKIQSSYPDWRILAGLTVVLAVAGLGLFWSHRPAASRDWESSIAVLPLENLSADTAQEYFADGITDTLITDLAKIKALRVVSRTSVLQFKRSQDPIGKIAKALGVDYVLEGTVWPAGERVRITAQLFAVSTERHLWAETYEGNQSDILTLQSQIARAIANQIKIRLTAQDLARLGRTHPVDPGALQAYLKGRYYWHKRPEGLKKSLDYFRQAVEKDPNYALGWAGLADAHNMLGTYYIVPMKVSHPLARAAAEKAIQLDDNLAEAHTALATVISDYFWDWPLAEREFQRGIELNPSYATARQWYAEFLSKMGRHDEALVEVSKAVELDPLSLLMRHKRIGVLYYARRYDEAIHEQRQMLEMEPSRPHRNRILGLAYIQKRMYPQALAELKTIGSPAVFGEAMLGYAYAMAGRKGDSQRVLAELRTRDYVPPFLLVYLNLALGDKDQALTLLEKAYEEREQLMGLLKVAPDLDTLRGEPRFAILLKKLNLDR